MFTEGMNGYVLDDNHFIVALVEEGIVDEVIDIDLVALCEEEHGLGVAGGGVEEALAVRVLADALEEGADGAAHLFHALGGLFWCFLLAGAGSFGWGLLAFFPYCVPRH